jgi:hypothetical protein
MMVLNTGNSTVLRESAYQLLHVSYPGFKDDNRDDIKPHIQDRSLQGFRFHALSYHLPPNSTVLRESAYQLLHVSYPGFKDDNKDDIQPDIQDRSLQGFRFHSLSYHLQPNSTGLREAAYQLLHVSYPGFKDDNKDDIKP